MSTMPDLWNLNPFLFILAFALMSLLLFYLIDRVGWQRKDKLEQNRSVIWHITELRSNL